MDYFEFYGLIPSFSIDSSLLRRKFLEMSRRYHPDFHYDKNEKEQERLLTLSTFNNEAYQNLNDPDKRIQYVLKMHDLLREDEKDKVPQEFLFEMMEINEGIMELEFDFNKNNFDNILTRLDELEQIISRECQEVLSKSSPYEDEELLLVKNYYFKRKYLLRIRNNLDKFAS